MSDCWSERSGKGIEPSLHTHVLIRHETNI
jgi:hypothetical protein